MSALPRTLFCGCSRQTRGVRDRRRDYAELHVGGLVQIGGSRDYSLWRLDERLRVGDLFSIHRSYKIMIRNTLFQYTKMSIGTNRM